LHKKTKLHRYRDKITIINSPKAMNEEQLYPYLNLIQQLLTCPNGEEMNILQQNQNLIDENLLQIMVTVAEDFNNNGRENEANFLINLAQQLAQLFNPPQPPLERGESESIPPLTKGGLGGDQNPQDYHNFLNANHSINRRK
jgi:hypothetical protein